MDCMNSERCTCLIASVFFDERNNIALDDFHDGWLRISFIGMASIFIKNRFRGKYSF